MPTTTREFKCSNCADGVVKFVRKESRDTISFYVKRCNKCHARYGFKSICELEEIVQTPKTSNT